MQVYFKLVLTMVLWGGTFIAARVAGQSMQPFSGAFCRFAIASFCLFLLTHRQGRRLPPLKPHQIPWVLLLGLSGVFAYNFFFFAGLQQVPAGRASLIVALNPSMIALCAALLRQETLTQLRGLGIALSLGGAAIVIGRGNPLALFADGVGAGEALILGCVASWVIYTLVGKRVMQDLSPLVATTYACWVGTIALAVGAIGEGFLQKWQQVAPAAWWGVLYLGILGTAIGFVWYYEGIQRIGSARASIFINLVPVFAIALAALFLDEPISLSLIAGGCLVISGVYLTNRPTPTPKIQKG